MPLTDSQIRSLKPDGRITRHPDGGGLYLEVLPSGTKTFRLRYYAPCGKRSWLTIGPYPATRLGEARHRRDEVKLGLRRGTAPAVSAPLAEAAPQVDESGLWRTVARRYLALRRADGAAPKTMTKLERQIGWTIEALGDMPVSEITAPDILALVRPIEEDGRVETAHEVRSRCSQVFRFAIGEGLATIDPASFTLVAMRKRKRGEFAGLTDPTDVGRLMRAIRADEVSEPQVRAGLLLSAYLFPRNSELRGMRWEEIDWKRATWEVPGARMKMKRDHLVPLPRQTLAVLHEIRSWTGRVPLVIPAPRNWQRLIPDTTFNVALRRLGFPGKEHVHHGFRTTFSTTMNEKGWNKDWIEKQLAHEEANKVRRSYNKAEYLEGRAEMMQAYADWLDAVAERRYQ